MLIKDMDPSAYRSGLKADSQQSSEQVVLFTLISLTASLCMLVLGILIGYALKARYSKVIKEKFESVMRRNPLRKQQPPSATASSSVIGAASSAVTLSTVDTTSVNTNTNTAGRKFNPYQYATRQQENSSLLYGSVNNKTITSSSSSSSRSPSECCSRQNSNASSKDSNGNGGHNSSSVKLMKSKNLITREYFTVQNDYGLMPPCGAGPAGTFTSRHYSKPPPPIAPPQIPSHRLSSTSSANTESSSASPTSSSSYSAAGAYNLVSSQTCLLNGVVAGSSVSSQPPLSSKQSNNISTSEVMIHINIVFS